MARQILITIYFILYSIAGFSQNDTALASRLYSKGVAWEMTDDSLDFAIDNFERAGHIYKNVGNIPQYVRSVNRLATCYLYKADLKKAEEYFAEIERYRNNNKLPYYPIITEHLTSKAYYFLEKSEFQKSIELHLTLIDVYLGEEGENSESIAELYGNLAYVYGRTGDFKNRIIYNQKFLEVEKAVAGENSNDAALAYNNLAASYADVDEFDKALKNYTKALDIWKSNNGELSADVGDVYNNIGMMYMYMSDFDKCYTYLQKGLDIRKEVYGEKHRYVSESYNNIGLYYSEIGNYKLQLDYYFKALGIDSVLFGKRSIDVALLYNNMASSYRASGNFETALEYLKQSKDILESILGKDHYYMRGIYTNLAAMHSDLGNNKTALEYNKKSLEVALNVYGEISNNTAESYHNLGVRYAKMGDLVKSNKHLTKALEIKEQVLGNDHISLGVTLNNLAINLEEEGKYELALRYHFRALDIYRTTLGDKNAKVAEANFHIANNYYHTSNYKKALENYQKSIIAFSSHFNEENASKNPDVQNLEINEQLLLIFEMKSLAQEKLGGQLSKQNALYTILTAIELSEDYRKYYFENVTSQRIMASYMSLYERGIYLADKLYTLTGEVEFQNIAFELMEKSKASLMLSFLNESNARNNAGIPPSLITREISLKSKLETSKRELFALQQSGAQPDSIKKMEQNTFALKEEYKNFISQLEQDFPSYYSNKYRNEIITPGKLQKQLGDNQVVIEYFVNDSVLYTFLVSHTVSKIVSKPIDSSFFTNLDQVTGMVRTYVSDKPEKYLSKLYEVSEILLPKEVMTDLKEESNLLIVPYGKLSYVPFDILLLSEPSGRSFKNPDYLVKKYSVNYISSASIAFNKDRGRKKEAVDGYLGFAPEYNTGLLAQSEQLKQFREFRNGPGLLAGNKIEVERSGSLFSGKMFIGQEATERSFKQNAGSSRILHLAMHALTDDENPLYSKFIFTQTNDSIEDNYLNVYELYNMRLNADLAVLSACETGYGKLIGGEGVASLGRAFAYAGCPSVVMSLWKADDEATKELMISFFKYLKEGHDKSLALREAKLEYLEKADNITSHPFFWANFVVQGDNSPITEDHGNLILWLGGIGILVASSFGIVFFRMRK